MASAFMNRGMPNVIILPKKSDDTIVISSDIVSKSMEANKPPTPPDDSNEDEALEHAVKVFKHKGVNTLIRNRILALENSVASKTVEKPPLKEVDKTISEVKKTENSEELIQQLKEEPHEALQPKASLPTSTIRDLALQMQKERPSNDTYIEPLVVKDGPTKIYRKESILKTPAPEEKTLPAKPVLKKQYSFTMESKFHEETGNEGWQKIEDMGSSSSSEYSDEESEDNEFIDNSSSISQSILNVEDSTDESDITEVAPPPPPPPQPKKKGKQNLTASPPSKQSKTIEAPKENKTTKDEEVRLLGPETVRKILAYSEGEGRESVINYYRRDDEDFSDGDHYYSDSDTYSQYSEYDRNRRDSQNRRKSFDNDQPYESDYGYGTSYYRDDYSTAESEGERYYTDGYYYSDDDRTLVDEDEARRWDYEEAKEDFYRRQDYKYEDQAYRSDHYNDYDRREYDKRAYDSGRHDTKNYEGDQSDYHANDGDSVFGA